jgi:hypothetical protein
MPVTIVMDNTEEALRDADDASERIDSPYTTSERSVTSRPGCAPAVTLLKPGSRVIPPGQFAKVLEWAELPALVRNERESRLEQMRTDLTLKWECELESLRAQLDEERAAFRQELAAQRLVAASELHGAVIELSRALAHTATESMRKAMGWGEPSAQGFYRSLLERLLVQQQRRAGITVVVAAHDESAVRYALDELGLMSGMEASVVVEPGVKPGQCLVRAGQEMYECDTAAWLEQVRRQLEKSCLDALLATAVQSQNTQCGAEWSEDPASSDASGGEQTDDWSGDPPASDGSDAFDEHEQELAEEALGQEFDFDPAGGVTFDHASLDEPALPRSTRRPATRSRAAAHDDDAEQLGEPWADGELDNGGDTDVDPVACGTGEAPAARIPRKPLASARSQPKTAATPPVVRTMTVRPRNSQRP